MVISKKKKKKRSSPKFGLLFFAVPHRHLSKFLDFAQIFRITARKIMVLPKYFLLTARKILILPKSSKLGGQLPPLQVWLCAHIHANTRTHSCTTKQNECPGKHDRNTVLGTETMSECLMTYMSVIRHSAHNAS